jgi:hypothetical protein
VELDEEGAGGLAPPEADVPLCLLPAGGCGAEGVGVFGGVVVVAGGVVVVVVPPPEPEGEDEELDAEVTNERVVPAVVVEPSTSARRCSKARPWP